MKRSKMKKLKKNCLSIKEKERKKNMKSSMKRQKEN